MIDVVGGRHDQNGFAGEPAQVLDQPLRTANIRALIDDAARYAEQRR
jgi:hypothetical protein